MSLRELRFTALKAVQRQNDLHAVGVILIRFPVAQALGDPVEVVRQTELNLLARGLCAKRPLR